MRLGVNDDTRALECALAIEAGGATELVVHARTKQDAYRPPAYWERIADIGRVVRLPLVANGEIWSVEDAWRCRQVSGCQNLMLGRGMVANPGLATAVRALDAQGDPAQVETSVSWETLQPLLLDFWRLVCARLERRQQTGRLKQWLSFLRRVYPQAQTAYLAIRTYHDPADVDRWLLAQGACLAKRELQ
jgi:tRNA-dihydrouridine synthase C